MMYYDCIQLKQQDEFMTYNKNNKHCSVLEAWHAGIYTHSWVLEQGDEGEQLGLRW